jgi:ribosomal protein L15
MNKFYCPIVNIDNLWSLVGEEVLAKARKGGKEVPVIDVVAHGYYKVLGKGRLPQVPFILRTKYVSDDAEKKIKAAGGAVELIA